MTADPLHTWLVAATRHGPQPAADLADELRVLRLANPAGYEDLPHAGAMLEALKRLEGQGLAVRVEGGWKGTWPEVVGAQKQGALFDG